MKIIRLSNLALKVFKADDKKIVDNGNIKTNAMVLNLFKNNKFRNLTRISNIRAVEKPTFFIVNASFSNPEYKESLQPFIASIYQSLNYLIFRSKNHIWIETDKLSYVISKVLN